jgi:hypothetical protein
MTTKTAEAQAVKEARRAGLVARRSVWRLGTERNHGGFMLIDPVHHRVVGHNFELSAKQVIDLARRFHRSEKSGQIQRTKK